MAVTRTISGTLDTFSVDAGSEVTYEGPSSAGDRGLNIRAFKVNPASTGNLIVTLDRSSGVISMEIFQEDAYAGSSAPANYSGYANIAKDGKNKGVVAMNVTDASKDYIVLLTLDGYSDISYGGSVLVP